MDPCLESWNPPTPALAVAGEAPLGPLPRMLWRRRFDQAIAVGYLLPHQQALMPNGEGGHAVDEAARSFAPFSLGWHKFAIRSAVMPQHLWDVAGGLGGAVLDGLGRLAGLRLLEWVAKTFIPSLSFFRRDAASATRFSRWPWAAPFWPRSVPAAQNRFCCSCMLFWWAVLTGQAGRQACLFGGLLSPWSLACLLWLLSWPRERSNATTRA